MGFPGAPNFGPPNAGVPKENPEEEAKSSRVRVLQDGKNLLFALDLILSSSDGGNLQNAATALAVALRDTLYAGLPIDRRHRLAQAGRMLGERGLTDKEIPPGRYPYGAFKRSGGNRADRDPERRIGWMAGLLPYLGQDPLYQRIRFDASWEDPVNWLVARAVIPEFIDPAYPAASRYATYPGLPLDVGATHFVGIAGIGSDAADYDANGTQMAGKRGILGYERSLALEKVKAGRGLSNTILLIEVPPNGPAGVTPWLAGGGSTLRGVPEQKSIQPFVYTHGNKRGTYVAMADGSVRFVTENISDAAFQAMCTVEGSAPADFDIDREAPQVAAPKAELEPPPAGQVQPALKQPAVPPAPVAQPPVKQPVVPAGKDSGPTLDSRLASNLLKKIGLAYHSCLDATGKPAAKWQDLKPYYEDDAQVTKALQEGSLVVYTNFDFRKDARGTSNVVLGYQREVPTRGGQVLMADGSVRQMSAADFAKAPQGGSPPGGKAGGGR
jgi:hypothetical protein